jgi:hypothetical protein
VSEVTYYVHCPLSPPMKVSQRVSRLSASIPMRL